MPPRNKYNNELQFFCNRKPMAKIGTIEVGKIKEADVEASEQKQYSVEFSFKPKKLALLKIKWLLRLRRFFGKTYEYELRWKK